ncbi:alpha/beta hydrolase [Acidocella aromatica]|uniref:Pimeloyl-ACP methyl ester carboxylesterase n=1 Tax=Acidocella aromatica TaxID=1303579 RepID=A0A840VJD8_9PROT|nr:alpha/beta hydrolase [Acidocella aromatica]MBB5372369.1 pimeloyl-ACP methyl ester carboxylesterase [Acidocella aromatica]
MPNICREPGIELAYEYLPGAGPVVVFCPGYASDMSGTKATALLEICEHERLAMLRFDYSGHGRSGGEFIDGTIGSWAEDAAFIISQIVPQQELLIVGSSMGGWIALLLALRFKARLSGLLLIAPAPDFTERLVRPELTPEQLETLEKEGVLYQPSEYGNPLPLAKKLLDDGKDHLLLDAPIPLDCPVRILHGMRDADVPWKLSLTLAEQLETPDVRLTFVKDGDHRLSRPHDLGLLEGALRALLAQNGG